MTKVNKNLELKKAINNYCEKKGISKNELSVQIGVNAAYLSKIETEKFDEITDEMLTKIRVAIKTVSQSFVYNTNDLASIFNQCEHTRQYKIMTGLLSDTGMGKTTSLRAYALRENVFFVTVDKTMTARQLLLAILKEIGISFSGNIHEAMLRIAEELNRLDTPLLIIDEAGKLTHTMILYLHDLREHTRNNCGIVLSGMPYFRKNLEILSERQKEGYAEFYRRVNIWNYLKGLSNKEVETVCLENGITEDFKPYFGLRFANLMNKILMAQTLNT